MHSIRVKCVFQTVGCGPWVDHEVSSVGGDQHFFFLMDFEQKISECIPGCKSQTVFCVCVSVRALGHRVKRSKFLLWVMSK